jgi:hypothetical protein
LKLPDIWTGVITTTIGAFLGTIIPIIHKLVTKGREEQKERRSSIAKAKSLLSYELDLNVDNLKNSRECSHGNWDKVTNEYYYLLSEDFTRKDTFLKLYDELQNYNNLDPLRRNNENKDHYLCLIKQAREKIEGW